MKNLLILLLSFPTVFIYLIWFLSKQQETQLLEKISELETHLDECQNGAVKLHAKMKLNFSKKNILMRLNIFLLFILIGCTKEIAVENPVNVENAKKITQLQEQLNTINSSLQASLSQNEGFRNEIESLQAQLASALIELESSEGQINSLLEQITALQSRLNIFLLEEAIELGVQDGTYIELKRKIWLDGHDIPDWTYLTNQGENGFYVMVDSDTISKKNFPSSFQINELGEFLFIDRWITPPIENSEIYPFSTSTATVTGINEIEFTSRQAVSNNPPKFRTNKHVYQKIPNEDLPLNWIYTNREVCDSLRAVANFNFYKDSIYSKIDPYDFQTIKEAFILDAQRNGLDISYIRSENLIIDVVDWNYGSAYAAHCQTGRIKLSWEDNYDVLFDPEGITRYLTTLWHELGHGVLNLQHVNNSSDIMFGNGYVEYDLTNFKEASRRMFQNIEQIPYECGFATQKKHYIN